MDAVRKAASAIATSAAVLTSLPPCRGRDAVLQAIVLKNFGARAIFFEHDRSGWAAALPDIELEDLGITASWIVDPGRRRRHREGLEHEKRA